MTDGPDGYAVARERFAAVNLISDPIHRYIELTKRLSSGHALALGLPAEEVAEEDLLDTAWVQRLRRISQLQTSRWVFPTAEHSRFTHGLGVMHEAGLWARRLYPSLRDDAALAAPAEALPSEGLVVETLRVAGLLHDAVEDCGGLPRLADVRDRFGDRVADTVLACSDSTDEEWKQSVDYW
ncbi:MAG: hypothetical protein WCH74_12295, partial [Chloroflexota bacterium]